MLSGAPVCRSQEAEAPLPHTLGARRLEVRAATRLLVLWVRGLQQAHQESVQSLQLQERGADRDAILVDAQCAPAEEGTAG